MSSDGAGRRVWPAFVAALLALASACSSSSPAPATAPTPTSPTGPTAAPPQASIEDTSNVPDAYKDEYKAIAGQVESFTAMVGTPPPGSRSVIGAELLSANANIGPRLLMPQSVTGVMAELDALQSLGVQGVVVAVSFPLLLDSTPDSQGYLDFYKRVAAEVRARNMALAVEANPVFSGRPRQTSVASRTVSRSAPPLPCRWRRRA